MRIVKGLLNEFTRFLNEFLIADLVRCLVDVFSSSMPSPRKQK